MQSDIRPMSWVFGAALAVALTLPPGAAHSAPPRPIGESRVVADLPDRPGFPEGVAVEGRTMYVSTPAQSGNFGDAAVFAFSLQDGTLLRTLPIHPIEQGRENGFAGIALDGSGHLYAAGQQGVVRLDLSTESQSTYAVFPDLHPCPVVPAGPCSPTASDRPPFPNDLAFDGSGFLYVTDSFQATVWRVPAGGGPPEIWCQGAALDGAALGPNGVRMRPSGSAVVVTVTGPPGGVFVLTRPPGATTCNIGRLHAYADELPDGLAFGRSGRLYVTLAGSNEVSVLDPDGSEVTRLRGPARDDDGSAVPWDAPASVAFDNAGGRLVVANHALVSGITFPQRFVVFDVFVDDRAAPLERPAIG